MRNKIAFYFGNVLFCLILRKMNSSEDNFFKKIMLLSEAGEYLIFYGILILSVQGRPFEVKEMFLEDILRSTGYANKGMVKYKNEKQQGWWTC